MCLNASSPDGGGTLLDVGLSRREQGPRVDLAGYRLALIGQARYFRIVNAQAH